MVQYVGHRSIVAKHIGIGKDAIDVAILRQRAFEWIEEQTAQLSLFPSQKRKVLIVDRGECIGVTHHFAYLFFMNCLDECGQYYLPPSFPGFGHKEAY